jgi:hypothetical protein
MLIDGLVGGGETICAADEAAAYEQLGEADEELFEADI